MGQTWGSGAVLCTGQRRTLVMLTGEDGLVSAERGLKMQTVRDEETSNNQRRDDMRQRDKA